MGAPPQVIIHPDADLLAAATAARLIINLQEAQAARGTASVVLTGGGIGTATLRAVRDSPIVAAVDWARVDVWWGDERFVPLDSTDRNDGQARAAMLNALPLDPARIFTMGDPDSTADADAAATTYARLLAGRATAGSPAPARSTADTTAAAPAFDVLLLGIGPDGHVASIFPGSPVVDARATTAAVRDSPKPPPVRITLTFPAIQAAREVWVLAAGETKADAVTRALAGACPMEIPAVGAQGRERTLWLLDRAAAAGVPALAMPTPGR
ncbi:MULTISPECIES: 6-phosphogluconolactonase [unclassified Frankia]|uniref:6-phosphogluconolactonase n=1 Tax=unclassified Frankia TaxID=2632575 RepID=UPI002AD3A817|nr:MULTISPECIES: 6-phosphogluconolactonase [unclassified Frankia]